MVLRPIEAAALPLALPSSEDSVVSCRVVSYPGGQLKGQGQDNPREKLQFLIDQRFDSQRFKFAILALATPKRGPFSFCPIMSVIWNARIRPWHGLVSLSQPVLKPRIDRYKPFFVFIFSRD